MVQENCGRTTVLTGYRYEWIEYRADVFDYRVRNACTRMSCGIRWASVVLATMLTMRIAMTVNNDAHELAATTKLNESNITQISTANPLQLVSPKLREPFAEF